MQQKARLVNTSGLRGSLLLVGERQPAPVSRARLPASGGLYFGAG